MLLTIEVPHKIIREVLEKRWSSEVPEHCDVKAGDFDGSSYRIFAAPNAKTLLKVSVRVDCAEEISKYGMSETLTKAYGDLVQPTPEEGYSVTLQINEETLTPELKTRLLDAVPLVKRYTMMAPLVKAFESFLSKQPFDPIRIPYRTNENMYIIKERDSVIVVFSLKFVDADDIVLSNTFLNEFKDARKNDRTVNAAPAVSYFQGEKPLEIRRFTDGEPDNPAVLKDYAFVSFALFDRHMTEANRDRTIDLLLNFRNYFHYHLKCTKAYMHFRMRDRVTKLLQNLEAAKDNTGITKNKKTASGRTFNQS